MHAGGQTLSSLIYRLGNEGQRNSFEIKKTDNSDFFFKAKK